jgi:transposase InsO family protein
MCPSCTLPHIRLFGTLYAGYRKIAGLLRQAGWTINDKRVERIWRREGLKVPHKQPKRGRLWLTDGSCIRLRPQHRNHIWSYDFVEDRTHDGRRYRMLNVLLPGDLEAQIDAFVAYYNHRRYHESIDNLTPADVYFGRSQTILLERERIKRNTIQNRRLLHHKQAA